MRFLTVCSSIYVRMFHSDWEQRNATRQEQSDLDTEQTPPDFDRKAAQMDTADIPSRTVLVSARMYIKLGGAIFLFDVLLLLSAMISTSDVSGVCLEEYPQFFA